MPLEQPPLSHRPGQLLHVWQLRVSPPRHSLRLPSLPAPACPTKCCLMGSRCWRRTASSLDAAETSRGRTQACDERFVPPRLSCPRAAGREKNPRLARAQTPLRCCKSALCVCCALQTLSIRAVPSPWWVATVWRSEPKNRAGQEKSWSPQKGLVTPALAHTTPAGRCPYTPHAGTAALGTPVSPIWG